MNKGKENHKNKPEHRHEPQHGHIAAKYKPFKFKRQCRKISRNTALSIHSANFLDTPSGKKQQRRAEECQVFGQ